MSSVKCYTTMISNMTLNAFLNKENNTHKRKQIFK